MGNEREDDAKHRGELGVLDFWQEGCALAERRQHSYIEEKSLGVQAFRSLEKQCALGAEHMDRVRDERKRSRRQRRTKRTDIRCPA